MRLPILAAAAIALASCAASPPPSPDPAFAAELAGRVAGPPQSCVFAQSSEAPRVIDSRTLAYGSGRTIYVNRLPGACPGLRPLETLVIEVSSGNYCRGDRFRTVQPGSIIPSPTCNLSDWVPYRRP